MNIGIVTTWFERGAAYVSKQYEELLKDEHDVFIYARGGEEYAIGDPEWDRENVHWGKRIVSPVSTYIDNNDFTKWLTENDIELVIFNEQRWWEPVFLCNKLGIKTAAYIDYYTEETIPFFAAYDALFCNTKRHFETFSWHQQAYYIPWGTDTTLFSPVEHSPSDTVTFFHSCGVSPQRKGTLLVLKAFQLLEKKYTDCHLVIHTQINLEKSLPEMKEAIYDLTTRKKLEIIEKTVTAPGLYYKGDVYVYPTQLEGIGLTIAEAISSGLPAIVPDDGPMNEFVRNGISGRVVKIDHKIAREDGYYWPKNICDLNDLVLQMEFYVSNKDKLKEFQNNARKYAEENLDWMKNKSLINQIVDRIELIDKPIAIKREIDKYFSKRFPGVFSFHWIYSLLYQVYKKLK